MNLGYTFRDKIYRRLRQDRMGSRALYSVAASLYWLTRVGKLYTGTRIVEIPWVLRQLRMLGHGGDKVLQLGNVILKQALTSYQVEVVDLDAEETSGTDLEVHKADIREVSLPQNYFDVALSISTLEHIGLMEPRFPDGDELAADIVSQALKPGGVFLLSVPFGRPVVLNKFRVYDRARLDFLTRDRFSNVEQHFYVWNKLRWHRVSSEEAETVGFLNNNPSTNLGLALVKGRKK